MSTARIALFCIVLAASQLFPAAPQAQTPTATPVRLDHLAGLWKAKRWFGPAARGPLVITRADAAYTADMIGRRLSVRLEGGELVFDLPNGEGSFRGKLESGGMILGHWFPPPSSAQFTGGRFASPVVLKAAGRERWRGEVVPFDDVFTFYLLAQKRVDGTMGAILRNPDRDLGTQIGADRLALEGNVVRLFGKRAGQTDEQELSTGTYNAETDVMTLTFAGRGGSYDFTRDTDESPYYPRGKNAPPYSYSPPIAGDDGWPTGTLGEAGIDRAAIERFIQLIIDRPMDSRDTPQVHAILIARGGKLVLEEYFHGEHRDKLHDTRSASKSVTATVVGAAIQAGAPLKLSTPVYEMMNGGTFPEGLEPKKRAMTLEHLLTMSSGHFCDDTNPEAPGNEEVMINQSAEPDYYRFTLKVPMDREPGERSVYCSGDPNLALGMVARATKESPMYAFDRLVGAPLGIRRYGWLLDPSGQPYGGGSVSFLPRDFLKFGQLMHGGGIWQGRRILGRDFVKQASAPLYHLRNVYYGYLWWVYDFPYKNGTVYGYWAGGAGGQGVVVFPELDLVIGTFAGSYSSTRSAIHIQQELIPRYILPAVRQRGDDPAAPVVEREWKTPYGRSPNGSRVRKP